MRDTVCRYTYYTCVAAGIRVPFKSLVTSMQLMQFVAVIAHFSYLLATHGFWAFPLMFLGGYSVYLTYLLLFVRFFVQAYVTKTAPGTRHEPFNYTHMGVNSIPSGSPHVRPMGVHRTCGGPNEIKKNTHPKIFTALFHGQVRPVRRPRRRPMRRRGSR